jgi:hypothetical protein
MIEAEACWRANDILNREIVPELTQMPKSRMLAQAQIEVYNWILNATMSSIILLIISEIRI